MGMAVQWGECDALGDDGGRVDGGEGAGGGDGGDNRDGKDADFGDGGDADENAVQQNSCTALGFKSGADLPLAVRYAHQQVAFLCFRFLIYKTGMMICTVVTTMTKGIYICLKKKFGIYSNKHYLQ